MKKFLIPSTLLAVFLIGQMIYHKSQLKQQQEVESVIKDAQHSMRVVAANPNVLQLRPVELSSKF